jgi:hypothetical protein
MGRLVVGHWIDFLQKNRGESINFEWTGSHLPKTRDRRWESWSAVRQQRAKRPHVPLLRGSGDSKLRGSPVAMPSIAGITHSSKRSSVQISLGNRVIRAGPERRLIITIRSSLRHEKGRSKTQLTFKAASFAAVSSPSVAQGAQNDHGARKNSRLQLRQLTEWEKP